MHKIDIRISTCSTLFGEKIVLRILNATNVSLNIPSLGLTSEQEKLFITELIQPQGLILVTGPTGSGKTLTLYSALNYLNHTEKNISSIEDPIEIEITGINQMNVYPKIGLDFASVLRALLRQDPDVIMIGEIRDSETVTIAMQAAQTGHLVLSTLHTNNTIDTITRLQVMGIATHHFINSISLIMAQRLIRKLCDHCKQTEIVSHDIRKLIGEHVIYKAMGCEHCHQGYQGRTGIFELLPITDRIMQLILSGADTAHLLAFVKKCQWPLLWDAGLEKVRQGITSLAELTRVIRRGI